MLLVSGCSKSIVQNQPENNSEATLSADVEFDNVALWSKCDKETSFGRIGGVSNTVLICTKFDTSLYWGLQENQKTLLAGDLCFDDDNTQPMYNDDKSFSSRLICIDGVFTKYPAFNSEEYDDVSERELKLLLKDLPENIGKKVIVYGKIYNMIPGQFQAYTSFKNHADEFDYGFDDSIFYAESELTKDLVDDDEFKAWVRIRPHETYETSAGGDRTTPGLRVDAIERIE
jgi:hypothetical protein